MENGLYDHMFMVASLTLVRSHGYPNVIEVIPRNMVNSSTTKPQQNI